MPELPEVETIRRDLVGEVVGRTITAVKVTGARTVRRGRAADVERALLGARIVDATRRGKYLVLPLDTGAWFVVHLRMSGQLRKADPGDPAPKHTHAVLTFAGGDGADANAPAAASASAASLAASPTDRFELRFVDPRTFGELFVTDPAEVEALAPGLAGSGVDPLDEHLTPAALGRLLTRRRRRLKDVLTDQRIVAGLGNIYSDEILHCAGLRFDRRTDALDPGEVQALFAAMQQVLRAAVAARGSSLADEQYVDLFGRPGTYRAAHRVYGRAGGACGRCGATIEKIRWQGRSTFFCPACQR